MLPPGAVSRGMSSGKISGKFSYLSALPSESENHGSSNKCAHKNPFKLEGEWNPKHYLREQT